MNISKILTFDYEDRSELLGRLDSDCKYYLGYGHRSKDRLWAKSEREQIEYMFTIMLSLPDAYVCVSLEEINKYAELMGVLEWTRKEFIGRWEKNGIAFEIYRLWGDKNGDRLECYTYRVGSENEARLFAKADKWEHYLDFVLYCQYNYKY